ncbi:MAG: long-chain fatty acid--CoA ligase [Actinomycetia bacterium]|nr:long-chain fatty acid--CoA ligase [Actinomycetes bacterium]
MNLASLLDLPSMIVPESIVLIDTTAPGGTRQVTYEELREGVSKVAGLLMSLGVEQGDRVGVYATNSTECIEAMFGASALGATIVPMNYRAADEETAHLLADSGSKVVFSEARYQDLIEANRPDSLEHLILLDDGYGAQRDDADEYPLVNEVDDDDLATLLYTSGTTSLPKGVKLTHGALSGYIMGANDAADGSDLGRMILAAPLYHVAGLTSMLNALYSGRVTVVMAQFEAEKWLDTLAAQRATHAFLVPTMLARILDAPNLDSTDLSSLEAVTYGAAPMPPAVIRRAIDMFPDSVGFSGAYGQTETTSTVAVLGPDDHDLAGAADETERNQRLARLRSVGEVLDDVAVRVVSPDGQVLDTGEIGEVQLMTYRAMDGYWGAEEKTRVTIDDEGWVHTGDLGYLDDDNYLFLTGRAGDMIIRGGENVAPEEIEAVIYELPTVVEVAVVGIPDEEWGERIVAAVVLREGGTTEALDAHCHEHLAPFKRPTAWHVIGELPRTSTGKVLRRNLIPVLEELGL